MHEPGIRNPRVLEVWNLAKSEDRGNQTFSGLQREVFKHFDEDSRPREDKMIHNKLTKPRKENISQQGHKHRKDRLFEFLKSVFVAFSTLL
jgi:hypothetical protein